MNVEATGFRKGTYDCQSASSRRRSRVGRVLIHQCQVKVSACQTAESTDDSQEDHDEGDVGSNGANEEDETDKSYTALSVQSPYD